MAAQLLMFDVEGTLVDCVRETLVCWRRTFRQFGYEFSLRELHAHSGGDPDDMIKALLSRPDAERLGAVLKEEQGKRYREECLPHVRAYPGVRGLFEAIQRAGYGTALVTSCAGDELNRYLELMGIADLLGATACGDDVDQVKPHPQLIKLALERVHCAPEHAVLIGDTPFDAEAANKAGVAAIGFLCGGFTEHELIGAGCRAVLSDLTQLREALQGRLEQLLRVA